MSPQSLDDDYRLTHPLPEWCYQVGLDDLHGRAADLAQAAVDDPFALIEYVSIGAHYFRSEFGMLVERLAEHEPALVTLLPAVADAMPLIPIKDHLPSLSESELGTLPHWLREIGNLECSGFMRRFDHADRSISSYLIEVRFPDGQIATGRLVIHHGEVDRVSDFSTMPGTLREAARIYRKPGAGEAKRAYRHVKSETGCAAILSALTDYVLGGAFAEDRQAPDPWPLTLPALMLMLKPSLEVITGKAV